MLWVVVALLAAIAAAPFLIRACRGLRGSPELKATLNALAIGVLLELIPLLVLLVRFKGQRRPQK
jgi:hypothetical protein